MGITVKDFINGSGFDFEPVLDGAFRRFVINGKKGKPGWYVGSEVLNPAFKEPLVILNFGDWSTGESFSYISKNRFDKNQKPIRDKEINKLKKIYEDNKKEEQEKASGVAKEFFSKAEALLNHEYLTKKKVLAYGLFKDDDSIAIPIYQSFNRSDIWSAQTIGIDGFKRFMTGGKISGGLFFIEGKNDKVYICEGYSTGASVHMATGCTVVVAFNAINLVPVTDKVVSHFKKSEIIICADNDCYGDDNAGIKYAEKSATKYMLNIKVPKFKDSDLSLKPTDFNDLMCLYGVDELKSQLVNENIDEPVVDVDDKNLRTEFKYFDLFFNKKLKGAIREKLSREFKIKDCAGFWQPVISDIKSLKSRAHQAGLNHHFLDIHLAEYIKKQKLKLLIEPSAWDGDERLLKIFSNFKFSDSGMDPDVCWNLFKEWCANIFRRANSSSSQNRILVFRGDQGIGKDYFIENVIGKALGPYFLNLEPQESNKENFIAIHGKLLANISEFDQTNRMAISSIKNLITSGSQRIRMPYEPAARDYSFHCSFFASCNFDSILRDSTGNRRFIIFDIEAINKGGYDKYLGDSDQILAEMYQWYLDDFRADKSCYDALDKFIQSETPDNPDELALEMAISAIKIKENSLGGRKIAYSDIEESVSKIAKSLGISIFRVQSVIKRNGLQKRGDGMRYYTTEDFRA